MTAGRRCIHGKSLRIPFAPTLSKLNAIVSPNPPIEAIIFRLKGIVFSPLSLTLSIPVGDQPIRHTEHAAQR